MRSTLVVALLLATAGCPPPKVKRSYPEPSAEALLAHVRGVRERVRSLRADTLSDARVGGERANVTVLMMAEWGGKLRFMAMNPNDSAAADLASDGQSFCYLDVNANCGGC